MSAKWGNDNQGGGKEAQVQLIKENPRSGSVLIVIKSFGRLDFLKNTKSNIMELESRYHRDLWRITFADQLVIHVNLDAKIPCRSCSPLNYFGPWTEVLLAFKLYCLEYIAAFSIAKSRISWPGKPFMFILAT